MFNYEDYLINLRDDELFDDLYEKDFNLGWLKFVDPKPEEFTIIEPEKPVTQDDGSVVYKYNQQGFRCNDFIINHNEKHILFAGCSETEGVGGNIEDAWSKILYEKISKEEKCSGFFNLSRSGWGWPRIIINCLIYFKKYGYPSDLFVLLPNHQRNFNYDVQKKKFDYTQLLPEYYNAGQQLNYTINLPETATPKKYFEDFVNFLISWKLFCEFCKSKNINLIFSCWDALDSNNIMNSNLFDNCINVLMTKNSTYVSEYYQTHEIKNDDILKRDMHAGRIVHNFWADQYYKKYKNL
jgi:hypothetical protein